ncbi:MAG: prepilin-type N-terminal cleavage/methylation domain-containing protein [Candidatus Berkelbacteria bacterium]|nr:prepilin-type N-terminal cleavage/methylation domain-containing protein [Candidatus Berkelbacteria bacterium]
MKKVKAFTLIELLVVVAIIAILAVVVVVSYNNAQKRARDSVRLSTLSSLEQATIIYQQDADTYILKMKSGDVTGRYDASGPFQEGAVSVKLNGEGWTNGYSTNSIGEALVDWGFLSGVPVDPKFNHFNNVPRNDYLYFGSNNHYAWHANLELSDALGAGGFDSHSKCFPWVGASGSSYWILSSINGGADYAVCNANDLYTGLF